MATGCLAILNILKQDPLVLRPDLTISLPFTICIEERLSLKYKTVWNIQSERSGYIVFYQKHIIFTILFFEFLQLFCDYHAWGESMEHFVTWSEPLQYTTVLIALASVIISILSRRK